MAARTGKTASGYEGLTIRELALLIAEDWKRPYFGAVPYIEAMGTMDVIDDMYGLDDGRGIVQYFLSNAQTWRGEVARSVKAELRRRLAAKPSSRAEPVADHRAQAAEALARVADAERERTQANLAFNDAVRRATDARLALGEALRQAHEMDNVHREAAEARVAEADRKVDEAYAEFDRTAARVQRASREVIRARRRFWALRLPGDE